MKYANKLTDKELGAICSLFNSDRKIGINELNITKSEQFITLEGAYVFDEDYEITDYDVTIYHHSGNSLPDSTDVHRKTNMYRKWMYERFGNEYAMDYLLNNDEI